MNELIPLNGLKVGEMATIEAILGNREHVHRLEELGVRSGAAVRMIQPGTPCIVSINSQRLCFRLDELLCVLVRPVVVAELAVTRVGA